MDLFVDEFDLPARNTDERGGAPDWAVVWPGRLWLIELKTEASSHRTGQLAQYAELASHHHRDRVCDLTYITPPLRRAMSPLDTGGRTTHLLWSQVTPLVLETWGSSDEGRVRVIATHVCAVLDSLHQPVREWMQAVEPLGDTASEDALELARLVARDGRQRGVQIVAQQGPSLALVGTGLGRFATDLKRAGRMASSCDYPAT